MKSDARVDCVAVSPDYFAAVGITVLMGRPFSLRDAADAPGVALLSDEVARRYWGSRERALGARIRLGDERPDRPWSQVVGIVGNPYPLAQAMRGAVHGVRMSDPVLYGGLAALLVLIAVAASYLPARRAMRLDLVRALRTE